VPLTRRAFATRLAASIAAVGIAPRLLRAGEPQADLGISHTAESIHQEATINAAPARVYAALTESTQFDAVTKLSVAMKSLPPNVPSVIGKEAGGTIALFAGYITGRQIELVPNTRIVETWRAGSWPAGDFSIVKFELTAQSSGTRLTLDHTGFPKGEAQHLAEGWRSNYFEPLAKYLAAR
jgi:activator of HSP90 ATPase